MSIYTVVALTGSRDTRFTIRKYATHGPVFAHGFEDRGVAESVCRALNAAFDAGASLADKADEWSRVFDTLAKSEQAQHAADAQIKRLSVAIQRGCEARLKTEAALDREYELAQLSYEALERAGVKLIHHVARDDEGDRRTAAGSLGQRRALREGLPRRDPVNQGAH